MRLGRHGGASGMTHDGVDCSGSLTANMGMKDPAATNRSGCALVEWKRDEEKPRLPSSIAIDGNPLREIETPVRGHSITLWGL